jgi:hypothetical protein
LRREARRINGGEENIETPDDKKRPKRKPTLKWDRKIREVGSTRRVIASGQFC